MLFVVWLGGRQQTSYRKDADRVRYIRTAVVLESRSGAGWHTGRSHAGKPLCSLTSVAHMKKDHVCATRRRKLATISATHMAKFAMNAPP